MRLHPIRLFLIIAILAALCAWASGSEASVCGPRGCSQAKCWSYHATSTGQLPSAGGEETSPHFFLYYINVSVNAGTTGLSIQTKGPTTAYKTIGIVPDGDYAGHFDGAITNFRLDITTCTACDMDINVCAASGAD